MAAVLVWFSAGALVATLLSDRMTWLSYSIDWGAGGPLLAAIGLAILVVLFRNRQTINVDDLDGLKG